MNFGKDVKDSQSKIIKVIFLRLSIGSILAMIIYKEKGGKWFWRLCGFRETTLVFIAVLTTILTE